MDQQPNEAIEQEPPVTKRKKQKTILLFVFTILLAAATATYDTFYGEQYILTFLQKMMPAQTNKNKTDAEAAVLPPSPKHVISLEGQSSATFKTIGKNILQCSKDGIKFYSTFGNEKWNDTYTMTSPMVITNGNYFAVAELMGRNTRVYNREGKQYEVTQENPIVKISVNKNGFLSVTTKNKPGYTINIYSDKGNKIAERREESETVYPLDVCVSNDNKTYAISYLDASDIEAITKILFLRLNYNEAEQIDGIYSAIEKNAYTAILSFLADNVLVAVSDNAIFAMDQMGKEIWSYPLSNQLSGISLTSNNYIALSYGDSFPNSSENKENMVEFLNLKGKVIGQFQADSAITYLNAGPKATIVGCRNNFTAIRTNGDIIWEHHAIEDVKDILFLDNETHVLYVTSTEVRLLDDEDLINVVKDPQDPEAENPPESSPTAPEEPESDNASDPPSISPPEEVLPEEVLPEEPLPVAP